MQRRDPLCELGVRPAKLARMPFTMVASGRTFYERNSLRALLIQRRLAPAADGLGSCFNGGTYSLLAPTFGSTQRTGRGPRRGRRGVRACERRRRSFDYE